MTNFDFTTHATAALEKELCLCRVNMLVLFGSSIPAGSSTEALAPRVFTGLFGPLGFNDSNIVRRRYGNNSISLTVALATLEALIPAVKNLSAAANSDGYVNINGLNLRIKLIPCKNSQLTLGEIVRAVNFPYMSAALLLVLLTSLNATPGVFFETFASILTIVKAPIGDDWNVTFVPRSDDPNGLKIDALNGAPIAVNYGPRPHYNNATDESSTAPVVDTYNLRVWNPWTNKRAAPAPAPAASASNASRKRTAAAAGGDEAASPAAAGAAV